MSFKVLTVKVEFTVSTPGRGLDGLLNVLDLVSRYKNEMRTVFGHNYCWTPFVGKHIGENKTASTSLHELLCCP